jgi:hypothetical protein
MCVFVCLKCRKYHDLRKGKSSDGILYYIPAVFSLNNSYLFFSSVNSQFSWNLKVHYLIHETSPLCHPESAESTQHLHIPYNPFGIILPSTPILPTCLFLGVSQPTFCTCYSVPQTCNLFRSSYFVD